MGAVWWRRRERESGQGMNDLPTTSFDRLIPRSKQYGEI